MWLLKGVTSLASFVLRYPLCMTSLSKNRVSSDWSHRHISQCLNQLYPALYPVLVTYHRKEIWTLNPWTLCVSSYRIFSSFSLVSFLPLPSSELTHTRPRGVLFPHFPHLLFLPLLHSLNSTFNNFSSGSHPLLLPTAIYPLSPLTVFSTDSPTLSLPISLLSPPLCPLHSLSFSFSSVGG